MSNLKLNTLNNKLNHGYASASQELQVKELLSKIQANANAWLANTSIDIDSNTTPYFSGSIINDDTVKSLEFCELIKIYKHRTVWMKRFYDELGRLA